QLHRRSWWVFSKKRDPTMRWLSVLLCIAQISSAVGLDITVTSTSRSNGNSVDFVVDGQSLQVQSARGMNVAVIDPDGGSLQSFQVFDTHAAGSEALAAFVAAQPSGSLVLFAARDDAQSNMTQAAKDAIKSCGGTMIESLTYRGSYALIGVKDGTAVDEKSFEDGGDIAVASGSFAPTQSNTIKVNSTSRSAGNEVIFHLDGVVQSVATDRGMNVAVIKAGLLDSFQVFDTHAAGSEALVAFMAALPSGTVVACGVKDEAMSNMSAAAKDAMKSCGATLIDSLSYRGSYALIGIKDGPALAEQTLPDGQASVVTAQ
ncbi:Protein FAM3B (Cytokine-like protein 2-21) (Pancreatic-derived factor) (PANDER), partial [Durusdinium trenchii]